MGAADRRGFMAGAMACSIALFDAAPAGAFAWPDGQRGAVSLTYDDGLDSQLDLAVPALDARGLRATFFVTMENIRKRQAEWVAVAARGHELGDHSVDHPCDLRRFAPGAFVAREIAPVERWLDGIAPVARPPVYAYPCDVTNLGTGGANRQADRYARLLRHAGIVAARTSEGAPNNPARVPAGAYRLQALAVGYDAPDLATVVDYLATAAARGHWAVLVFHEITRGAPGEGAVTVARHAEIVRAIAALPLWCAPLGTVFAAIRYRDQKLSG